MKHGPDGKRTASVYSFAEERERRNPMLTAERIIKQFEPRGALVAYEEEFDGKPLGPRSSDSNDPQEENLKEAYYHAHLAAYRKNVKNYSLPELAAVLQKHRNWENGRDGGERFPGAFLLAVAEAYRDKSKHLGSK